MPLRTQVIYGICLNDFHLEISKLQSRLFKLDLSVLASGGVVARRKKNGRWVGGDSDKGDTGPPCLWSKELCCGWQTWSPLEEGLEDSVSCI